MSLGQIASPVAAGARRYPGVRAFSDADADRLLFRGREQEAQALFHMTLSEPLVVLFGRSGFGKSSLLNAGLLHLLRNEGHFPVVARVNDPDLGPSAEMFEAVADAARREHVEYRAGVPVSHWHFFKTLSLRRNGVPLTPVLVFDQFEELFTLHTPETRHEFINQLANLVRGTRPRVEAPGDDDLDDRPPRVRIILSMREDFLADLSELSSQLPRILKSRFRLGALHREQAEHAIVDPAALDDPALGTPPFRWSDAALNTLLDFLCERRTRTGVEAGLEVEPFQLQLICQYVESDIVARSAAGETDLVVEPEHLGTRETLQGLLTDFYEESIALASQTAPRRSSSGNGVGGRVATHRMRARLWRMCEQGLISGAGRRLSLEESDLERRFGVPPTVLTDLVTQRLLRHDTRSGDRYYELSHDTLVEPIYQSREKRQGQRRHIGLGVVAAVALVFGMLFFTVWLPGFRNRSLVATAKTAYYERNDPTNARLALLRASPYTEGWVNTASTVVARPIPAQLMRGHDGGIRAAAFDRSASRLVTASMDETARLWDARTGQSLRRLTGHTGIVRTVAFDRTGRRVATGSSDQAARVWLVAADPAAARDGACGPPSCLNVRHRGTIRALAFDPRGDRIVTASEDGTAILTDFADPDNPSTVVLPHEGHEVYTAEFHPSGNFVVTSTRSEVLVWQLTDSADATRRPAHRISLRGGRLNSARFTAGISGGDLVLAVRRGGGASLWRWSTHDRWIDLTVAAFDSDGETRAATDDARAAAGDAHIVLASTRPAGALDEALVLLASDGTIAMGSIGAFDLMPTYRATVVEHPGEGSAIALELFPPGRAFRVLTAWSDGTIRLWRTLYSASRSSYVELHHPGLTVARLSPDAARLVTTSTDGSTRIWDVARLASVEPNPLLTRLAAPPLFSPDSTSMLITFASGRREVWTSDGTRVSVDSVRAEAGVVRAANFVFVPLSEAGAAVGATSYDGTLIARSRGTTEPDAADLLLIRRTEDDSPLGRVDADGRIESVAFNRAGTRLLINGNGRLQLVRMVDFTTRLLASEVQSASFDPLKDRVLAVIDTGAANVVQLLDFQGNVLAAPDSTVGSVNSANFSANGDYALLNTGPRRTSTSAVWDLQNTYPRVIGKKHSVNDAAVNGRGDRAVVGAWDGASVWSVRTVTSVALPTRVGQVQFVAFNPTDERVLTATDYAAHLWTRVDGTYPPEESWTVEPPRGTIDGVAFTPDGRGVLVYGNEGDVWLWRISTDALLDALCALGGDGSSGCPDDDPREPTDR